MAQAYRTAGIIDGFSFQRDGCAHQAVRIRGISLVFKLFETVCMQPRVLLALEPGLDLRVEFMLLSFEYHFITSS